MSPGRITLLAVLVGVILWPPLIILNQLSGNAPNNAWMWWYVIAYPLILLMSFGLGRRLPTASWRPAPVAVASSYVVALALVPQTGTLLPFELAVMVVLALIGAGVGKLGSRSTR